MKDETIQVDEPPEKQELENFWRPLYETEKQHTEGEWINIVKVHIYVSKYFADSGSTYV